MLRKIKSLSELPPWFDLAKFAYLKDMDAKDWARVISYLRHLGQDELKNYLQETDCEISADEIFSTAFPLEEEEEGSDIENRILQYRYGVVADNFQFRGISALSNGVVAYLTREFKSIPEAKLLLKRPSRRWKNQGRGIPLTQEQKDYADRPFFLTLQEAIVARGDTMPLTNNRAISVNMSLPDDMLIEDFREWLKASRALSFHKAAPKIYTKDDFAKWCDNRFVPYSILSFWAKATDVEITHGVMAAALFPSNRMMDPDRIRRTIKPACELWLCQETIDSLHAQAAKSEAKNLPTNR